MLEILKYPDPRLKRISEPVVEFGPQLHRLLDAMATTMYAADGIGLAAPQVGETLRAFVIDLGTSENKKNKLFEFINPEITEAEGKIAFEEGCLSVPGVSEEVSRNEQIRVKFKDRFGKSQEMQAEGLLAVAIQHENDHLNGVLFVEKLSPLKRRLVKKKLQKAVTL